jgi:hypothetical protein
VAQLTPEHIGDDLAIVTFASHITPGAFARGGGGFHPKRFGCQPLQTKRFADLAPRQVYGSLEMCSLPRFAMVSAGPSMMAESPAAAIRHVSALGAEVAVAAPLRRARA